VFAFDLLYLDGASLAHLPLTERRRQLARAFPAMRPGYFTMAESVEFKLPGGISGNGAAGATDAMGAAGSESPDGAADGEAAAAAATAVVEARGQQQGQALDAQQGQEQGQQGSAAAAAAAAAAEVQPSLEDRLQECLLEAFAAGTGERGVLVVNMNMLCRWHRW